MLKNSISFKGIVVIYRIGWRQNNLPFAVFNDLHLHKLRIQQNRFLVVRLQEINPGG